MTQKDFLKIATLFHDRLACSNRIVSASDLVRDIANHFSECYPKLDKARFCFIAGIREQKSYFQLTKGMGTNGSNRQDHGL